MSALTEHEIAREARLILRQLAQPGTRLVQRGNRWELLNARVRSSNRAKVPAALIKELEKRNWIAPLPDSANVFILSREGHIFATGEAPDNDFAAQHKVLALRTIRDDEGEERVVTVNEAESPLDWLKSRGGITAIQHEAGERLRRDYTIARLEPRVCSDWSAPVVSGGGRGADSAALISDAVLAAKQRFSAAMRTMGPGLSDLLFDVCCALRGLEASEEQRGWPRRSGKVVLALALDRLAAHYGIKGPRRSAPISAWSAESDAA
ncbi:MAG TPA: DUF6456 domain-containing protein [Rhizomicrobium sp.]|jgi:hypothetical protein